MRLKVLHRDKAVGSSTCEPVVAVAATQELIGLQEGKTLTCPDLQEVAKLSDPEPNVSWFYVNPDTSVRQQNLSGSARIWATGSTSSCLVP